MLISVVLTVKNEERHISDLLDSLVVQQKPFEIIIIDSESTDRTQEIIRKYAEKYPEIKLYIRSGTRGECRNFGIQMAKGECIAFTDGDCIANPFWLKEIRATMLEGGDIVAGRTINIGYHAFEDLNRVELYHEGFDITYPSCNLAYRESVLNAIGGFDSEFITAEDIDMNYRAISKGHSIIYNENAIIYHRMRSGFVDFFKQAFWNGYGRKQLTRKHGSLWHKYTPIEMLRKNINFWYLARLGVAMIGYFACKVFK